MAVQRGGTASPIGYRWARLGESTGMQYHDGSGRPRVRIQRGAPINS